MKKMPQVPNHHKIKRATLCTKRLQYLGKIQLNRSYKSLYEKLKGDNIALARALSIKKQEYRSLFSQNAALTVEIQDLNLACNKRNSVISHVLKNSKELLKMFDTMTGYITNTISLCQEFANPDDAYIQIPQNLSGHRECLTSTKSPATEVVKPTVSRHSIKKPTINLSRVKMQRINVRPKLSTIQESPTTPNLNTLIENVHNPVNERDTRDVSIDNNSVSYRSNNDVTMHNNATNSFSEFHTSGDELNKDRSMNSVKTSLSETQNRSSSNKSNHQALENQDKQETNNFNTSSGNSSCVNETTQDNRTLPYAIHASQKCTNRMSNFVSEESSTSNSANHDKDSEDNNYSSGRDAASYSDKDPSTVKVVSQKHNDIIEFVQSKSWMFENDLRDSNYSVGNCPSPAINNSSDLECSVENADARPGQGEVFEHVSNLKLHKSSQTDVETGNTPPVLRKNIFCKRFLNRELTKITTQNKDLLINKAKAESSMNVDDDIIEIIDEPFTNSSTIEKSRNCSIPSTSINAWKHITKLNTRLKSPDGSSRTGTSQAETLYTCTFCDKTYRRPNDVAKHSQYNCPKNPQSRVSTMNLPHVCRNCSRRFNRKGDLSYHIKHVCSRKTVCTWCNNEFEGDKVSTRHVTRCKAKALSRMAENAANVSRKELFSSTSNEK